MYRITRCGDIWLFAYLGAYGTPIFGEGEVVGVSDGTIRKRAMVVSYRLSIVTVEVTMETINLLINCNLRSNVSDAQINRGWVTLGQNFRVFPME